jgi:hypothetical protein
MIEKHILVKLLTKYNRHMRRRLGMLKQKNQLEQPTDEFNEAFYAWLEEYKDSTNVNLH